MNSIHKIWFITKYSFPYTGAPFLYNVPEMFSKRGYKVTIFSMSRSSNDRNTRNACVGTKSVADFLKCLYRLYRKGKLDIIIYNHMILILLFTVPILLLRGNSVRVFFVCESKWFSKIGDLISPLVATLVNMYYAKVFVFDQLLMDYLINRGFDSEKMIIISTGVNFEFFNPIYSDEIVEKNQIIYVGTLHPRRKLDVLIESLEVVALHYKDIRLVIVGDGPDKPRLEKLVLSRGLERNIMFLGEMEQPNVSECIKRSLICLAPYPPEDYDIQLPYKVLEYAACAKPIVTTCTTATQHYLKGRAVMTRFDKGDLAKGIISLLENEKMRRELGASALEISNRFSWDCVIHKIEKELSTIP